MPKPIALCVEDTNPSPGQPRYVACVAVAGGLPGLGLDRQGEILWKSSGGLACELWVSVDEHLILYRPVGAAAVWVHRGGRSLGAPCAKPVVLLDQDEVELPGRRLKLHVHGLAKAIAAPSPIAEAEPEANPRRALRTAAAALALGSLLAGGCIEVRASPPKMVRPPSSNDEISDKPPAPDAGARSSPDAATKPDKQTIAPKGKATKSGGKNAAKQPRATKKGKPSPPIEVREKPPSVRWD